MHTDPHGSETNREAAKDAKPGPIDRPVLEAAKVLEYLEDTGRADLIPSVNALLDHIDTLEAGLKPPRRKSNTAPRRRYCIELLAHADSLAEAITAAKSYIDRFDSPSPPVRTGIVGLTCEVDAAMTVDHEMTPDRYRSLAKRSPPPPIPSPQSPSAKSAPASTGESGS